MVWKIILKIFSFLLVLTIIGLLLFYQFIDLEPQNLFIKKNNFKENYNFTINSSQEMQFYSNLRFSDKEISYKIYECSIKKENDMEQAFAVFSNLTVLKFYKVDFDEEIKITCSDKEVFSGGLFTAGEGGPTEIISTDLFNIIKHGKIILIRESNCFLPNVALHELLHTLGFKHSANKNNIMYSISNCDQTIGEDIPQLINRLYETPDLPDLYFANASAQYNKKFLNINVEIKNQGLKSSSDAEVLILLNNKTITSSEINSLEAGEGIRLTLSNIFLPLRNIEEIELYINSSFNEINKKNNKIRLTIEEA